MLGRRDLIFSWKKTFPDAKSYRNKLLGLCGKPNLVSSSAILVSTCQEDERQQPGPTDGTSVLIDGSS